MSSVICPEVFISVSSYQISRKVLNRLVDLVSIMGIVLDFMANFEFIASI